MGIFQTEQEEFWAGEFGDNYTERNQGSKLIASNIAFFAALLKHTHGVQSVIEFGANRGLNLLAIRTLLPEAEISAVEINKQALDELNRLKYLKVYSESVLNFVVDYQRDFVLSKGLLIHIDPEMLGKAYENLYTSSSRYICLAEYYNPAPVEIPYRGNRGKLFKRDFAGEMMEKYPDLVLLDYGFVYHRDNYFSQDDISWFLLQKTTAKENLR